MTDMKTSVIVVVGPTGVGKTAFSINLAERISGEIISADSMQAYRSMDIMSQKPTPGERGAVTHHLVDILDPREEYSAALFAEKASACINKIIERRKVPVVVGGSGLYVKALIDGLFPSPKKDAPLRDELASLAKERGPAHLYKELEKVDPEAAGRIHQNDLRRVIRAIEVFRSTGTPISEHKKRTKGIGEDFGTRIYGLIRPRENLYRRIDERVDKMFNDGLVGEVRSLKEKQPSATARASVGYKEILGYLNMEYSLKEAAGLLKKNTRRLAKKQLTWFRADKRIRWIDLGRFPEDEGIEKVIRETKGWRRGYRL